MSAAALAQESTGRAVSLEPVTFPAGTVRLAGNLYRPYGVDPNVSGPAVVVTGTWTSVKEQMADRYAEQLARQGLTALSFDFTGFGLSGGQPREVESAGLKARDVRAAASFLSHHPAVAADRVGVVAICASAMYAALAVADNDEIQAMALVAPWLHDAAIVRSVYGDVAGVRAKLEAADLATARYQRSGVVEYVPVADPHDPRAAMPMAVDFYADPRRGNIAGWPNRFAVMAWREWLTFDAIALAPRVRVPTLIVHSEAGAIPDGARRFHEALRCPKEITWLDGTQFDFYDQHPTVDTAVRLVAAHQLCHLT